jgi:cytochrome c553
MKKINKLVVFSLALLAAGAVSVRAADTKETWDKLCAKCHGPDGKGQTKMGQKLNIKDFSDAKVQAAFTDEEATKAIKDGVKDKEGKILMKAQEGLSDDDIKALVAYVRSFKK